MRLSCHWSIFCSGEREELRRTVQHLTGSLAGLGQVFSVTASGDYRLVT